MSWQTLAPVPSAVLDPPLRARLTHLVAVGDPAATRTVYTTIIVLVVLGVVLACLAVWVWRRTRPEPELLAPLEVMDTRSWRKLDPAAQRRLLDESRPDGAAPLTRSTSAPAVDSSFATVAPVASFDDLSEADEDADAGRDEPDASDVVDSEPETGAADDGDGGAPDTGPGDVADGFPAPDAQSAVAIDPEDRNGRDDTGEIEDDDVFDLPPVDHEPDAAEESETLPPPRIDPLLTPKQSTPDASA